MAATVATYFAQTSSSATVVDFGQQNPHHHHDHHQAYVDQSSPMMQQQYGHHHHHHEDDYGHSLSPLSSSSVCSSPSSLSLSESKPTPPPPPPSSATPTVSSATTVDNSAQIEQACRALGISADPYNWNEIDVRKWLMYQQRLHQLPGTFRLAESFPRMNGMELCELNEENLHKQILLAATATISGRKPHYHQDEEAWRCATILYRNLNVWRTVCIKFAGPEFFDDGQQQDYYGEESQPATAAVQSADHQMQYQMQPQQHNYYSPPSVNNHNGSSRSSVAEMSPPPPPPLSNCGNTKSPPPPPPPPQTSGNDGLYSQPLSQSYEAIRHHPHHESLFMQHQQQNTSDYGSDGGIMFY